MILSASYLEELSYTVFYAADCIQLSVALETEATSEPLNIQQVIAYVLTSLKMDKRSI